MKVSESWLRNWVNPDLSAEQLAGQLTMAGLEVDAVHPVAGSFEHVVVAEVTKTEPHPQADKLTICHVEAGDDTPHIVVCGASNVRSGLKVALAKLGAILPGGFKIKKVKLRGQLSCGMLCSASELGLEEQSDGIMELSDDAPVGTDLREYMQLEDNILDIDLTPNRSDCFSHLGIAREVAAFNDLPINSSAFDPVKPSHDQVISINIEATNACPQYFGRLVKNITPGLTSPLWLKERLRRCGIRPHHPVVDVTNYVMLALGQPMHAFDAKQISGQINVRYAKAEEPMTLLDGQDIKLNEKVLVIADDKKPLAMAGVMGSAGCAVLHDTTDVFLESAFFAPRCIAGVARKFGLFTDSSQRFERGVDPKLAKKALEYATELLLNIIGGEPGPITECKNESFIPKEKSVSFNPDKVLQVTGVALSEERMKSILNSLGLKVLSDEKPWHIEVPTHRFDISLEVDLIEEIIRLYGYQNIQAKPMVADTSAGTPNALEDVAGKISRFLVSRGYHETISYSFVDPDLQDVIYPDKPALTLLNPISPELSQMRLGLWPGLIASMVHNLHRQHQSMKLFEAGVVFDSESGKTKEISCLAGLITGKSEAYSWASAERDLDFFDVKGDIDALFRSQHVKDVEFSKAAHPALHPGKSAQLVQSGQVVGEVGVLHPRISDELGLGSEAILFHLNLSAFLEKHQVCYRSISKFPQIRRDLSLLVDQAVPVSDIKKVIEHTLSDKWLKTFDVFDVFEGSHIPEGKKSIAVSITLQDAQKTLTDEEINSAIDAILNSLKEKHAITLRD